MILSHQHKFLFLKTKKTAGTSVELALSPLAGPDAIVTPVSPEDEVKRQPGDQARNFKAPAQPGRAAERLFFNHIRAKEVQEKIGPTLWNSLYRFSVERNPWDRQVSLFFWRRRKPFNPQTFDAFMESEARIHNFRVYSIGGDIVVDRVLRFERLSEELSELMGKLGLRADALPRAKGHTRPVGPHYSTYYTPATRRLIEEWYPEEIEAFGYRFETES